MNNGKGLHAWVDELEDLVSVDFDFERGGIIAAIQER
jgi:hypothetical protein